MCMRVEEIHVCGGLMIEALLILRLGLGRTGLDSLNSARRYCRGAY